MVGMIAREMDFSLRNFWIHVISLPHNWINVKKLSRIGATLGEAVDVDLSPSSGLVLKGGRIRVINNIFKPFFA